METLVSAKTAILATLIDGKGYGLDLIERVKKRTSGAILLKEGSVYPALRSLEREGFVESFESDPSPERGGRPRRYYKLTTEGMRAATDQRHTIEGLLQLNVAAI